MLAWTGLPTCVGVGPTKTPAKLANHLAKKNGGMGGVCDLTDEVERARWLARTPLNAVWGIGPASQAKLQALGCETVAHVRDLDPKLARKGLTVVGERIIHELRGHACLALESLPATRKGCAVTRCFSGRVEDRATMEQAVATHASRLGEKLRREGLGTDHVGVFFHTSEHDVGAPQRSVALTVEMGISTDPKASWNRCCSASHAWDETPSFPDNGRCDEVGSLLLRRRNASQAGKRGAGM